MKRVLIVFGGCSFEHDISIKSAENIYKYIDKNIFEVSSLYIDKNNVWYEFDNNFNEINIDNLNKIENIIDYLKEFDIVFNIIHGNTGEDGKLQSMFELFNIKYLGSNSISSMLSMNKELTKQVLKDNNIKQVNYCVYKNIKDVEKKINYPLIIKPSNGGSSIGINIAYNNKELKKAIKKAQEYNDIIIVEEFIQNNIELECSIIDISKKIYVSTVGQIAPTNHFYDYNDKYIKDEAKIIIPADISNDMIKEIKETAKKVFTILNCKDFARIDFLVDKNNNTIYLNEINTLPGFTNVSMFAKLLEYDKYSIKKVLTKLINKNIT